MSKQKAKVPRPLRQKLDAVEKELERQISASRAGLNMVVGIINGRGPGDQAPALAYEIERLKAVEAAADALADSLAERLDAETFCGFSEELAALLSAKKRGCDAQ